MMSKIEYDMTDLVRVPKFMWNAFDDAKRMEVSGPALMKMIRNVMGIGKEKKK